MANKNKDKNQKSKVNEETKPVSLESPVAPAPEEVVPAVVESVTEGETPPVVDVEPKAEEEGADNTENQTEAPIDAPANGEPDATNPEDEANDPVLDDDEEMMEEQSDPLVGKQIKHGKLKKFKVRHRAWNRRSPLRVIKEFDFDNRIFNVGTVFDWAKDGYKPASVQRLFSLGLVRHVVEDCGVQYPFREIQVKRKKSKLGVLGYDFLSKSGNESEDLPAVELTDEEKLELNRAKHGIGKVAEDDKPKNFSIAGSHKK